MIWLAVLLCAGCALSSDIYFPGQTSTNQNSIHNVAAELNRNTVLSFIGQPSRVDLPEPPNPFVTGGSGVPLAAPPNAGGGSVAATQQRPPPTQGFQPSGNQVVYSTPTQQNRPLSSVQPPKISIQTPVFNQQPAPQESYQGQGPGPSQTVLQNQPGQSTLLSTAPNGQFQPSPYVSFAYQLLANSRTGSQNLVLSPILTQATLALLQHGAGGMTREQIAKVVQIPLRAITQLISTLNNANAARDQQSVIEYASTVFINNDSRPNRTFAAIAQESRSNIVPVNFRQSVQTIQLINSWVSQATRRAIPSILDQNSDTRQLEMLLVNAMYFKSNWKYAFKDTEQGHFYNAKANRKLMTFMRAKQYFPTGHIEFGGQSGGVYWVEIPYAGEEFSMVILVPRFRDTLLSLMSELSPSHVQTIINQLGAQSRQLVDLKIPKFDIETRTSLVGALRDMGLGRLFTAPSELLYINENQSATVGDCIHSARLSVDEVGTIAAAANAFSIIPLSISAPDPEMSFVVDQPFLVMVMDTRNRFPLFVGKVFDP